TGRATQAGKRPGPHANACFIRIGEVAAMVLAFALPPFEAAIQQSARLERPPQARKGLWQLAFGHVQQAGAGPDAVIAFDLLNLIEAFYRNGEAQQLAGTAGQLFAGIEGADLIALLLKRPGIAAGAATSIENTGINRQPGKEGHVKAAHVDVQR